MSEPVTIDSVEKLKSISTNLRKAKAVPLKSFYGQSASDFIPHVGGLYVFWWTGDLQLFLKNIKSHKHLLKGKQTELERVNVRFSDDWINMATVNNKICLYVGKTTNLNQRVTSHVKPKTESVWGEVDFDSGRKPNTVSQMRIGLERIFKNRKGLKIILENVSLSFIELDGIENCVNRFYLEDLTVGTYFPLLNIDIER